MILPRICLYHGLPGLAVRDCQLCNVRKLIILTLDLQRAIADDLAVEFGYIEPDRWVSRPDLSHFRRFEVTMQFRADGLMREERAHATVRIDLPGLARIMEL